MNNAIELALKTWYDKDHPLHFDPLHPAIKLAGEAGEILDLYGKYQYKPNFSWWNCKHCGCDRDTHIIDNFGDPTCDTEESLLVQPTFYTALILDELGDYWFYLRILSYIYRVEFHSSEIAYSPLGKSLADMNYVSAGIYRDLASRKAIKDVHLNLCHVYLINTLELLNSSIEEITELNYIKLNSEPTAHGWKGA